MLEAHGIERDIISNFSTEQLNQISIRHSGPLSLLLFFVKIIWLRLFFSKPVFLDDFCVWMKFFQSKFSISYFNFLCNLCFKKNNTADGVPIVDVTVDSDDDSPVDPELQKNIINNFFSKFGRNCFEIHDFWKKFR